MEEITLQQLLEAGCHFGHKSERWNPRASEFIYTEKDGIHIIDLAKTKAGLEKALQFVKSVTEGGGEVLFVGTKRQAKGVVKEAVEAVGAPYFVERWIGGFLTNWDAIRKNIEKANRMASEKETGAWKQFPKHEQVEMDRMLTRLRMFYGGVLTIKRQPQAMFIIDVRKEISSVREALRVGIPIVAIVDTNSDPRSVDYIIPANDDAVGSIRFIVHAITSAYDMGRKLFEKAQVAKQKEAVAKEISYQPKKATETETPKPAVKEIPAVKEVKEIKVLKPEIAAKMAKPVQKISEKTGLADDVKVKPEAEDTIKKKRGRPKKI